MSGFDDAGIFFSDNFGGDDDAASQVGGDKINRVATKRRFKDFIRQVGRVRDNAFSVGLLMVNILHVKRTFLHPRSFISALSITSTETN